QGALGVSRETLARFDAYLALLERWNPRINLVSRRSLGEAWQRHILDSAQLFALAHDRSGLWVDLGSGGGLPGIIIAIMAREDKRFTVRMIEADTRKAAFLNHAIAELALPATVEIERIEAAAPAEASVISARALAPLPRLLQLAAPFATAKTLCLFPKGRSAPAELTEAEAAWHIDATGVPSRSDPDGSVLVIRQFRARA
ncbi:MAG: 16S rRNA (guanine(527)-N(7))-methyltransferase RsmG, partial [Pseudomonadota bacterium]